MFEKIIKIPGKTLDELSLAEVAQMIMADSAISPRGNVNFSSCALDEFLHNAVLTNPELEQIRSDILESIYIDVDGTKEKKINVEFLKTYAARLAERANLTNLDTQGAPGQP
ncbi:MAG: hypothetical protein IT495_14040 [Gammaproteobacteria bacterium]|nr:hypothetical protein [Gammaproteobacteria bacterium]